MTDEYPEHPRVQLFGLRDLPARALVLMNQSPVRAALATDEGLAGTPEVLARLVDEQAWPVLMGSVSRRGIKPQGHWVVLFDDFHDWREVLAASVVEQITTAMVGNPDLKVLGVAHLVDSVDLIF